MTPRPVSVRLFVAYQFGQVPTARNQREVEIMQAVQMANDSLIRGTPSVQILCERLNLESWRGVGQQVTAAIGASTLFVADISELNQNVIFELGFALGMRNRSNSLDVCLMASDTVEIRSLPSDLLGCYVEIYGLDSFVVTLARVIVTSVTKIMPRLALDVADSEWHRVWGMRNAHSIDIICSEIPPSDWPAYAEANHPNFLRYAKFADLDSLVALHELCAARFPNVTVHDYGASESIAQHRNGILVGGPAWNRRVQRLLQFIPIKFVDGAHEESDSLVVELPGLHWRFDTRMSEDGIPMSDYFVFARLAPDDRSNLLFFGGGLTHGVLGGVKTFGNSSLGLENAAHLSALVRDALEIVVVGRIEHIDGYVRVPDFRASPPCLVLARNLEQPSFYVARADCRCNLHKSMR